jgi:hypothetical protein
MSTATTGRYASGYLGKQDEPLAASPALTTASGDLLLGSLMAGRTFENIPRVKPLRGRLARPEPLSLVGAGSSLTTTSGSSGVRKAVNFVPGRNW